MKIETTAGVVTLLEPDQKKLEVVRSLIPLNGPLPKELEGARYGVVMECGAGELWAIKQQPVDVKRSQQDDVYMNSIALVVSAIKSYLDLGFSGVLMPCVYMREKPKSMVEVGIAYFGAAAPGDAAKVPKGLEFPDFGDTHGIGFGSMVMAFIKCLGDTSKQTGIPLSPIIDMDHRPRSALGVLVFSFLIHGQDIYSLKINPTDQDPVWTFLRSSGIQHVYALPSVPMEMPSLGAPSTVSARSAGEIKTKSARHGRRIGGQ